MEINVRATVYLSIAVLGILFAAGALADAPPPPAPAQPAAATHDPGNQVVCRTMGAKTGSRLGARRECRTQKEWDDIQRQNQDETSKMQTRGLTSGVIGQ
jgi:hypothetical protein